MATEEQSIAVVNALAEYFDCEIEDISGFVVGVEHMGKDGQLHLSAMWPADAALWQLRGYMTEIGEIIDAQRQQLAIERLMEQQAAQQGEE